MRAALVCPYCRDSVVRGSAAVACAREECRALYHGECWTECTEEHGHCAVYGCLSAESTGATSVWSYFVAAVRRLRSAEPPAVVRRRETVRRVVEALSRREDELITERTRMVRADSLDLVEVVMELEEKLDVSLSDLDLSRFETVGDLITYLHELRKR